jgi:hypothetical protein
VAITSMKIRVVLIHIFIVCFGQLIGQRTDSVKVDINHIFFCVDSITYENLFKHEFIGKIFADTSESSGKTLTDSWTGKYIMGRDSYIEVFSSNPYKENPTLGDKFGDLAIVFKTKKSGDINKIHQLIRTNNRDAHLKLQEFERQGKIIPFTRHLYLTNPGLEKTFRPYVDEKTMEFLKLRGFSESEIQSGITEQQFWEKIKRKKYEKLYDNIEKIELILTNEEFQYLAESLKYFGFSQNGYQFTDSSLEIICSIQQNRRYKLKAIHFTLLKKTEDINIEVSKNLTFKASGIKASFQFTY